MRSPLIDQQPRWRRALSSGGVLFSVGAHVLFAGTRLAAGLASVLVSLGFAATRIGFATSIIRLPGMWPKRLPAGKLPPTPPP